MSNGQRRLLALLDGAHILPSHHHGGQISCTTRGPDRCLYYPAPRRCGRPSRPRWFRGIARHDDCGSGCTRSRSRCWRDNLNRIAWRIIRWWRCCVDGRDCWCRSRRGYCGLSRARRPERETRGSNRVSLRSPRHQHRRSTRNDHCRYSCPNDHSSANGTSFRRRQRRRYGRGPMRCWRVRG